VLATYRRDLGAARALGPVTEDAKKKKLLSIWVRVYGIPPASRPDLITDPRQNQQTDIRTASEKREPCIANRRTWKSGSSLQHKWTSRLTEWLRAAVRTGRL
jgi:hypothetical protein